tara:strand:- start:1135 stop:1425 length:291 start_codon:yes stop_codon:yes gene_type:complete
MTKEQFVDLLREVLEKKKIINTQFEYIQPYDNLFNNCLLGYELSYANKQYEENTFTFKVDGQNGTEIEASCHLKHIVETLVKLYGKKEVVKILKDL